MRHATIAATLVLVAACGLPNPNDSEPARQMREALRIGMTLREVCTAVAPLSPTPSACIVGRRCSGSADTISITDTGDGYAIHRFQGTTESRTSLAGGSAIETVLAEVATTCSFVKVGYGYYDIELLIDATGRVLEISPILIEGNRPAGWLKRVKERAVEQDAAADEARS